MVAASALSPVVSPTWTGAWPAPTAGPAGRRDPLDTLVETVLSQHTSDLNSGRAFASLKAPFRAGQRAARRAAAGARAGDPRRRPGAREEPDDRAPAGRGAAARGRLRPRARCAGCASRPPRERLRGLPGVGPKTRACVLLFACGKPAFPVDTHVHRIVAPARPGAGGASAARRAGRAGARRCPRAHALALHLNLIRLGREVCRPREPRCPVCPLRRVCAYARSAA